MKKIVDKLIFKVTVNKKMITFLVGLMLIGVVAGSVFVAFLTKTDQGMLKEYISTFMTNIEENKINYSSGLINGLTSNLFYVTVIWLLGISVIGIPITLFMFFSKAFVLGFSLTSIIMNYQLKGTILAFFYIFPHHIFNMMIYIILMIYSLTVSLKIIKSMIKKEAFDFRKIIYQYSFILLCSCIGVCLTTIMEVYFLPTILKVFL